MAKRKPRALSTKDLTQQHAVSGWMLYNLNTGEFIGGKGHVYQGEYLTSSNIKTFKTPGSLKRFVTTEQKSWQKEKFNSTNLHAWIALPLVFYRPGAIPLGTFMATPPKNLGQIYLQTVAASTQTLSPLEEGYDPEPEEDLDTAQDLPSE